MKKGRGSLKILCGGGGHIFSQPKRDHFFFFQSLILNLFLKKECNIRNQSASCTTEPLFVSLSNTALQIFCLIHNSSILKDLFIKRCTYCTVFRNNTTDCFRICLVKEGEGEVTFFKGSKRGVQKNPVNRIENLQTPHFINNDTSLKHCIY